MTAAGIEIKGITVHRGGRPVIRDVSMAIEPGKITALLGRNGAGKSSLVMTLAGVLKPTAGQVWLDGLDISGKRPEVVRAAGIAAVPEGHQVLTDLTVEENLIAAGSHVKASELPKEVERALAVFPEIKALLKQRAGTLSGGQQQMLALAQAIIGKPKFLLVDELSLGLAPLIVARLMHVVEEIASSGVGVLLIEQFVNIALKISHRVYVLDRGVIRFDGSPDQIKDDPNILHSAYLAGEVESVGPSVSAASSISKREHTMGKEYKMYINGEWVSAGDKQTFDDFNPYTGEVYARIPNGTLDDTTRAIEAAAAAFPGWAATPPIAKQKIFLKAADIMERRQDELVKTLMEENGSTIGIAMFQMFFVPGLYRQAAAAAYSVTGEIIPADYPGAFFMAVRQPAGVVAAFGPFNVPYILCSRAFALPVAYGNTAVLKPSEEAPLTGGILLAEIFEEAGMPPGVLNVITSDRSRAADIGELMISHPAVRRVSFTGSTEVGRIIAEKSGKYLKRAVLELGGKDPLIILKDANVDFAADAASWGAFLHQGQICMSTERIIVERPIADEFIGKLAQRANALKVGDPRDPTVAIGPLINEAAVNKVHAHVQEAIKGGAELVAGGSYENLLYKPTILTDITPDMRIFTDQTFGPIAPIIIVDDAEEALSVANNSKYGLSSGIITNDLNGALDMAMRLDTGMVHIGDQTVNDEPQVPFGGVKGSGYGRMGGKAALDEFTELRWISVQRNQRTFP